MDALINVQLLRNPVNWVIVLLMVIIGNLAMYYLVNAASAVDPNGAA